MLNKKTIRDVDVDKVRCLVRVDFNVPLKDGKVTDDTRIRAALPTIEYLLEHQSALVLCSHLGRPKGEVVPELSLRPVAERLGKLLGKPVLFIDSCIGIDAETAANDLKPGEILLVENTRFYPGEKKNDPEFSRDLAKLGDLYVNDAFGSAHRAHASTVGVTDYLPAVAGFLMEKELDYLGGVLENPSKPFIAILGGAKISDKIGVVESLLDRADKLLIGGGMANTFLAAVGNDMAESLVESDSLETAKSLLDIGASQIVLPSDLVVADQFAAEAKSQVVPAEKVPMGWRAMDIGPETVNTFKASISEAGLIVWNGPMGVFEFPEFSKGTRDVAKAVADAEAVSVVGGGDSAAAINEAGLTERISHVSTGGGASLEMLEGKTLPGVAALQDR